MNKKTSLLMAALLMTAVSVEVQARVVRGPMDQQTLLVFHEGTSHQQYARFHAPYEYDRVPANQPDSKDTVTKMRDDDEGTTVLFHNGRDSYYLKKKANSTN